VAKPPRLKRPKVKRGRAIFFEDQEFDEDYEVEIGLTFTHPATFPLEFTNVMPPEATMAESDQTKTPNQFDSPAVEADPTPLPAPVTIRSLDRPGMHRLHEPIVHTRSDGTRVVDSHRLEDPSAKYY
jgi:hypothetical protein